MLPIHISRPPCTWSATAHAHTLAKASSVFRMMPVTSHPSPWACSFPTPVHVHHCCPILARSAPCSDYPWRNTEVSKNLGTGCDSEKPSRAAPWGWNRRKKRRLCLGSQTGNMSWCCSPSMQGTSFMGEERKVEASYKCSVLETWPAYQQRASISSPNYQ